FVYNSNTSVLSLQTNANLVVDGTGSGGDDGNNTDPGDDDNNTDPDPGDDNTGGSGGGDTNPAGDCADAPANVTCTSEWNWASGESHVPTSIPKGVILASPFTTTSNSSFSGKISF